MPRKSTKSLRKHHKYLLPGVVAAVVLVVGLSAWAIGGGNAPTQSQEKSKSPNAATSQGDDQAPNGAKPNLAPATAQDKTSNDEHKQALSTPPPPASSGKKTVYPVITSASRTEVNAYVSGVIEDGGSCSITATKGSEVKNATSTGFDNVSYTSCHPMSISLSPGTWSINLQYSSSAAGGQTTQTFEVN
jgi:hypothetical protein